jgi:hypothetical protein
MNENLKAKFEEILEKHNFVSSDGGVKTHKSFIIQMMKEVYELALNDADIEDLKNKILVLESKLSIAIQSAWEEQ